MDPFIDTLPEELRKEPSLQTFKDAGTLAKSYVEAQKLIGAKRIALPGEKATPEELGAFYAAIGRPETFDKYETPEIDKEAGLTLDPKQVDAAKQKFHELGLTNKQAKEIMSYYFGNMAQATKAGRVQREAQTTTMVNGLREEWGDKYDANVEIAKAVINKFGDEKFLEYVNGDMGNNVPLIKMLHKLGSEIMEDRSNRGGATLPLSAGGQAHHEIEQLKLDAEFQKILGNAQAVGHRDAVERWVRLHALAFPGQEKE